jgi:dephospho-CoA kinase
MPSFAITGSIGSGKSLVLGILSESLGAESFSADVANRRLLAEDQGVREMISRQLGNHFLREDGSVDKKRLFQKITSDEVAKKKLESILHPRLRSIWKPLAKKHRHLSSRYFIAEIPLLYENELSGFFDRTIMVGCSHSIRKERLLKDRNLSADEVSSWLKAQLPQDDKILRSDHLIWNDGTVESLKSQIAHLGSILQ